MRSHEERFAETKRRIAARQRREQRRRSTITTLSAAVACLVLIVSVSFAMPGIPVWLRGSAPAISRAMKPLPVCMAAARRWGILSSGFCPFFWACA